MRVVAQFDKEASQTRE